MSANARRRRIQEFLASHDKLTVEAAVGLFQASPATIRRDFTELVASGGVERFRGGIRRLQNEKDSMIPVILRAGWYSAEKRYLAWRIYEYLKNVRTLFVDGGSTTTHLGMFLRNPEQTIITNSITLCNVVSEMFPSGGGAEIRLTGGRFYPESGLLLGSRAEEAVAAYHAEAIVLSARGITSSGIYNHNDLIAGINLRMIENSDRVILVADHSKIGFHAMNRVCPINRIEALFTVQTEENRQCLEEIRAAGVKVFCDCPFDVRPQPPDLG